MDEAFDELQDDISDDALEHHGVLGQKWGVRRYQNEDGSRTQAGKRHREDIEETGGSSTKSRLKKAAIAGGVILAGVAVGYALHKSGAAKAGFDAISGIFNSGVGKTKVAGLPSKTASNATDAVYKANKAAKAARESGATKTVAEAARTVKSAGSVKGAKSVADAASKATSGGKGTRGWTKKAKTFRNIANKVFKSSKKTSAKSSVFSSQAAKYSDFASDLINKMK